jgi:hypothetical protein
MPKVVQIFAGGCSLSVQQPDRALNQYCQSQQQGLATDFCFYHRFMCGNGGIHQSCQFLLNYGGLNA